MNKKYFFVLSSIFVFICTILFIIGCGSNPTGNGGSSGSTGPRYYFGTQSPGDAWSWKIDDKTFSGSNEMTGLYITGEYAITGNGFIKATIESSSIPSTLNTGDIINAYEFPGIMLLIKPGKNTNTDRIIVCSAKSAQACIGNYNCSIISTYKGKDFSTDNAYITFEVVKEGAYYGINGWMYRLDGSFNGTDGIHGMEYSDGVFYKSGFDFKICVLQSGILVNDPGSSGDGWIGLEIPNNMITSNEVANSGIEYKGMIYDYCSYPGGNLDPNAGTAETHAVEVVKHPTKDGVIQIYKWVGDDLDNGVLDYTSCITLECGIAISNGVFASTYSDPYGSSQCKMVASKVNGKYILEGLTPSPKTGWPRNIILIQK
jgi:hypothetical protein